MSQQPDLIVLEQQPFNAAPPLKLLKQTFITSQKHFYVRNHGSVPAIDPANYRLSIAGQVRRSLSFSLDELRQQFPKRTLTITLACAGNRRDELIAVKPIPGEEPWSAHGISTAVWSGVALRDVLLAAEPEPDAQHIAFTGLDEVEKEGKTFGFGGSIPIAKALSPEVLLAYEMNGQPLSPQHGFPLRAIVPGYTGARSVKWLADITLQRAPSDNYFQTHAYKVFPPDVTAETADWTQPEPLGELSINSVICQPTKEEMISTNSVVVAGYAIAGGGHQVEKVELSQNGGKTWVETTFLEEPSPWRWRFWQHRLNLQPDTTELIVRAWDSAGNTQPEDINAIWNFKGYMNNAWHRVTIKRFDAEIEH